MSIFETLQARARQTPAAPAIHVADAPSDLLTYADLLGAVSALRQQLQSAGVRSADRVAIVLDDGPAMALIFLAACCTAVCAPLNPAYGAAELNFYLDDLRPALLLLAAGQSATARGVAGARGLRVVDVVPRPDRPGRIELNVPPAVRDKAMPRPAARDTALILHTSGTTSRAKMVPLSHDNLCASATQIAASLGLTPSDSGLLVMPLFHIHGLVGGLLSSLTTGASVICTPGFRAPRILDWLEQGRATWYTAVPTMHQAILARAGESRRLPHLHFIRSCSAALPPLLMQRLERCFGVPVVEAYGMTEGSHQLCVNPQPPAARKAGSVGRPAGTEVRVVDAAGTPQPGGVNGEIVVRGANVMHGYLADAAVNKAAFFGAWFRTGDVGYVDDDGYVFLTGRIKELINRGGEKIAPREIDEALATHAGVAQALAFGFPHPTLGEGVAAAVVAVPGASLSTAELQQHVARQLAPFKVPEQIVVVDEIPQGPTGKPQRLGLAERLGVRFAETAVVLGGAPPETPLERLIVGIWRDVLAVDAVGVDVSFVSCGGDSLLAAQVLRRLVQDTGVELGLVDFLQAPTIRELAVAVLVARLRQLGADETERLLNAVAPPSPA